MKRRMDRAYLPQPTGSAATLPAVRSLAVLIVTGADRGVLEACLRSVVDHLPDLPVYVCELSGAGCSGHPEPMAGYPAVHWMSGTANLGFAEAVNTLVQRTPPETDLLLLDPGAVLRGPLIRTRELLRRPGVAAVAPMTRGHTGSGRDAGEVAHRRPWLAISRAAWNAVGGFDEEFFGHGEVADWQSRARAAGWRVLTADEVGAETQQARIPEPATDAELRRDRDLLRANTALLLEHQHGVGRADRYLAGATLLDRLQRSKRDARRGAGGGNGLPAIVILTNRLVYGGAERQKVSLATELDRRGYPVTIVCLQRFGPLVKEVPPTVRVVRQPWWAPILDLPSGPAVLISGDTNTETGFATLWRAAGTRRRWLVAAHIPPDEHRRIYSRPLTTAMRRADGFIALARHHWDMLIAHHRLGGRVFFAPNGVAVSDDPAPRVRTPGAPVRLVMLSRIVEHKNPHLLIEALHGLLDMSWRLSIFGDGPDRERLQARTPAELRDRVQWHGWSAGPGPALADADLLCVPSRSEAFPLVILEAMARAVPVAASAVCAVPEILDHGSAGFVVEPVSVSGWREQLAAILADPGALPQVGRRGFERLRKHYTVEAMTDAYLDAINTVL
ncbi:glycosyltransferase [Mycobacterium sp.]|uniref:glycosyltransferase n=1 Tax=Mycobacterium sp. TaxID=1785 RepID=UPI001283EB41|nr:glycosyltransferase [Mycobacterium sp.]KAA8966044.1 MAG: glycosyltransferase [Mycobacterium sp.]